MLKNAHTSSGKIWWSGFLNLFPVFLRVQFLCPRIGVIYNNNNKSSNCLIWFNGLDMSVYCHLFIKCYGRVWILLFSVLMKSFCFTHMNWSIKLWILFEIRNLLKHDLWNTWVTYSTLNYTIFVIRYFCVSYFVMYYIWVITLMCLFIFKW